MQPEHRHRRRIFAAVLAAGASRRFGTAKQLARLGGETLVHRAAAIASACCAERTLLVTGHEARAVTRSAGGECRFFAVNENYAAGIGSSIALAARILDGAADAMLLVLADQPLVSAADLGRLVEAWSGRSDHAVLSRFDGATGPPALLPAGLFAELCRLNGDSGARALLSDASIEVTTVDVVAAAADVDTPADLERIAQAAGSACDAQRSQLTQPESPSE